MRRFKLTIVTDGAGNAIAYTPRVSGKVHSIQYVKAGANAYADGVDFAVTSEATGAPIWSENNVNASAVRYPRAATHDNVGGAALYAAGGVPVLDRAAVANDRLKVVIAQGGATKTGDVHILVD